MIARSGGGRWLCPACGREFGRRRQSHVCVPGNSVDETFAGRPAWQRETFDVIMRHIDALGPVHSDAVGVGVFLKRRQKFAEVRPLARSLALWLALERRVSHPRIARRPVGSGGRIWHMLSLTAPAQVDDGVHALLTEAFMLAGDD